MTDHTNSNFKNDLKNVADGNFERAGSAAILLQTSKEAILESWEKQVRTHIAESRHLAHPILINTLPAFLDKLVEALAPNHERSYAFDSNTISREHGCERARLGLYSPPQLLKEFQLLRDCIFAALENRCTLTLQERDIIWLSIEKSTELSLGAFFLTQESLRDQFTAALGHDLRNPLASAKMSAELLMDTLNNPGRVAPDELRDDLAQFTTRIVQNIRRVDKMIQNLLDVSVLQRGEDMTLNLGETNLARIVDDTINDFGERDRRRIQFHGSVVRGIWDGEALRRALENLITNAIKYGSPNTPITVTIESAHERALLHVHNVGNPIPEADQAKLFQAFRRSDSAKASAQRGWGIGLALVKAVTVAHAGSVIIDSNAEKGTTFTIDIPLDSRAAIAAHRATNQTSN